MDQPGFVLNLSLNEALATFTRYHENVVTILDLKSGDQQLEINTGVDIRCLQVTGSTLVAAHRGEISTWKLDARNARANVRGSVRITKFNLPSYPLRISFCPWSVSSDLSRIIAFASCSTGTLLGIHDVSTGWCVAGPIPIEGALEPLSIPRARFKATDINGHTGMNKAWYTADGRGI